MYAKHEDVPGHGDDFLAEYLPNTTNGTSFTRYLEPNLYMFQV